MKILFIDPVSPYAYDQTSLETRALGGTEATVIRVAEGLKSRGHEVYVSQWAKQGKDEGSYVTPRFLGSNFKPDAVVLIRSFAELPFLAKTFPNSKKIVWLHDTFTPGQRKQSGWGTENIEGMLWASDANATVLGVSEAHHMQIKSSVLSMLDWAELTGLKLDYIYNPVVLPEHMPKARLKPNKLVFFSSPHKGLADTLQHFTYLRQRDPDTNWELHIANPGYMADQDIGSPKGVIKHGPMTHKACLTHVQDSFALFYPNFVFPETFGLVYAEANALGVPVLTYGIGAAGEVLKQLPSQVINPLNQPDMFIERLLVWAKDGRPSVGLDARFKLEAVLDRWEKVL